MEKITKEEQKEKECVIERSVNEWWPFTMLKWRKQMPKLAQAPKSKFPVKLVLKRHWTHFMHRMQPRNWLFGISRQQYMERYLTSYTQLEDLGCNFEEYSEFLFAYPNILTALDSFHTTLLDILSPFIESSSSSSLFLLLDSIPSSLARSVRFIIFLIHDILLSSSVIPVLSLTPSTLFPS